MKSTGNKGQKTIEKKLYNLETIFDMASGDFMFVKRLVSEFIEDTPGTINAMFDAFENWDYDALKKISHRLKPVIKTLNIHSIEADVNDIDSGNDVANTEKKINHIAAVLNEVIAHLKKDVEKIPLSTSSQSS